MQIIVYYVQDKVIYSSQGKTFTEDYLETLLNDYQRDTIQAFYNLDHAVACICKLIGLSDLEIKQLWITPDPNDDTTGKGRVYHGEYELNYYPKTMLTIDRGKGYGHPFCILSDMTQYMTAKVEPNLKDGEIFSRLNVASNIAREVYDSLVKLGLSPKSLTSPIRAYRNKVLSKMNLPNWKDLPEECANYYYNACTGGWVEALTEGHFEKILDWDLRSAYPFQTRKLIDFRKGKWEKVESVPRHNSGMLGIFNTMVEMEADFHPIVYRDEDNHNYTPSGTFPAVVTWNKLDYMDYHRLGKARVKDGWVWTPNNGLVTYPLKGIMNDLYEKKGKAQTDIDRNVIKRILVGVYGVTGETLKFDADIPFGEYFNPCWRAEVENNTHLRVMNFCQENDITPIAIMTDGILTDVDLKVNSSTAMGEWKLDSATKGLVMGSGCIALQGKQKDGDFSLNYDELVEIINKDEQIDTITIEKEGFVSIGEAIERNILDKLGQFEINKRSIVLNHDLKRIYIKEPKSFGELMKNKYESIPVDASMI